MKKAAEKLMRKVLKSQEPESLIIYNKVMSNTDEDVKEILSNKKIFNLARSLK